QRDRRHRHTRPAALPHDLELVFQCVGSPTRAVDANTADGLPSRCTLLGVHYLHGGHHLRRGSESIQDGIARTLTALWQHRTAAPPGPCPRSIVGVTFATLSVERYRLA